MTYTAAGAKVPKPGTEVGVFFEKGSIDHGSGDYPTKTDKHTLIAKYGYISSDGYTIYKILSSYVDYCSDNNHLVEYYCDATNPETVSVKVYDCMASFGTPCSTFIEEENAMAPWSGGKWSACRFGEGDVE